MNIEEYTYKGLQVGNFYAAQKIPIKDIWKHFGGSKSTHISTLNATNQEKINFNSNALISSDYLSFNLVCINRFECLKQENQDMVIVHSSNIDSSINSPKNIEDFGILVKINSSHLDNHSEDLILREIEFILNKIKGIEYSSINYCPSLKIDNDLNLNKSLPEILECLGYIIIKEMRCLLTHLDCIEIEIYQNMEELLEIRSQIEAILQSKRGKKIISLEKLKNFESSSLKNIYLVEMDQYKTPFGSLIITPISFDPLGYLSYSDLEQINIDEICLHKFNIQKIILQEQVNPETGESQALNQYFRDLSFGEMDQIQLWGTNFPLPCISQCEVILFQIPGLSMFGLLDYTTLKKIFKNISFANFLSRYGVGYQFSNIIFLSRYDLISPRFKWLSNNWNRIAWCSHNLYLKIEKYFPENLRNKIATELDAVDFHSLQQFLQDNKHPEYFNHLKLSESELEMQIYENLISNLTQTLSHEVKFPELKLKLISSDGNEYQVELKNAHLTAEKIRITLIPKEKEKKEK